MDPFSRAIERAARVRGEASSVNARGASNVSVRPVPDPLMEGGSPETIVNAQVESLLNANKDEKGYRDSGYAFDILKVRLQKRLEKKHANAFFVTSPSEGNGKTNTAVNLAFSLAQSSSQPVVLVDMDLRNPGVHRCLNVEMPKGVADLITGSAQLEEVAFKPGIEQLTVLPGRVSTFHATDLITSNDMKEFIALLCRPESGRLVVFDMPPVLGCADTIAFSALVKHFVLVVEAGKTKASEIDEVGRILEGADLLGTVLNRGGSNRHVYL